MQDTRRPAARAAVATALDLLAVGLTAAFVVLALGAQTRFRFLGLAISITDPVRPLLGAVLIGVVRIAVARRLPPFPAWRSAGLGDRLEAERDRLGSPARAPRELKYYAAAAALGSLIWVTPHLLHIRRVPDVGDPIFSAWRLARLAHQLTHDPARLFDGNIFHPAQHTLTYSDATVLQGLAATPFLLAGLDPLVVSNALLLAAFPLGALAFFHVAWRLTSDPQAACIAGLLGGLWPFRLEHYSHLELQYFLFAPLALLALLRLVARPTLRAGLVLGAFVALQWFASMYFGVMLLVFLAPVALVAAAAWGLRPYRQSLSALAVAAVITAAAFAALSVPYMKSQAARGERSLRTVAEYSATGPDYRHPHRRLRSHYWLTRVNNEAERELFTGLTAPALAAVGIAPPLGVAAIAILTASAAAFDGSLGLNGLIYDDLYAYAVPFRGMRVPARFAVFVGTGLILLASFGCRRLFAWLPGGRARAAAFAGLAALVVVDLRSTVVLRDFHDEVPAIYEAVSPDMVLAEFPMIPDPTIAYMYFSTTHWARLLNGHSGYIPESYNFLQDEMQRFPVEGTLDTLRRAGVTHVTVNCMLWRNPARCEGVLAWLDGDPGVRLVKAALWEKRPVRLYAIR